MISSFVLISAKNAEKLIRVEHIREIVPLMALQESSLDGRHFRGLINLRGEIIPIFDFDEGPIRLSKDRFILISETEDKNPIGVIVDDVHDIVGIENSDIVVRDIGSGRPEIFTLLNDRLVSVFDPKEIVHASA